MAQPGFQAEVVVVGGGPAGSAIASFLARAGVDVTLLERAHFPRDKPCAEYLSPQASRLLKELAVLEEVQKQVHAELAGMAIRAPDGTSFTGEFASVPGYRGFRDSGIAIRRQTLDAILLERARTLGAKVMEGVTVNGLLHDAEGRTCGVTVRQDETLRELRAPLVIGADGLRTVVGRRLGLIRSGGRPRRMALVMHYTGVASVGHFGEMHVFSDGYVGLANTGGGVTNVAIVVPTESARQIHGNPEKFADNWIASHPSLAERFSGASRIEPPTATGPFNQRARQAWSPGAALVGDAADFFDPFTGEGIYAALRGAELLTPYAFDAVRSKPARHDIALSAWERCRRNEFRGKWRVEKIIGTIVSNPFVFNHAARVLARNPEMAHLLVGVTGDFVPAREVLRPGYLFRLLPFGHRFPGSGETRSAASSPVS